MYGKVWVIWWRRRLHENLWIALLQVHSLAAQYNCSYTIIYNPTQQYINLQYGEVILFFVFAQFFYYIWKTFKITYLYTEERLYLLFVLNNRRRKKTTKFPTKWWEIVKFFLNGNVILYEIFILNRTDKRCFCHIQSGDCTKYKILFQKFVVFFFLLLFKLYIFVILTGFWNTCVRIFRNIVEIWYFCLLWLKSD